MPTYHQTPSINNNDKIPPSPYASQAKSTPPWPKPRSTHQEARHKILDTQHHSTKNRSPYHKITHNTPTRTFPIRNLHQSQREESRETTESIPYTPLLCIIPRKPFISFASASRAVDIDAVNIGSLQLGHCVHAQRGVRMNKYDSKISPLPTLHNSMPILRKALIPITLTLALDPISHNKTSR